jgi:arabinan endo-1,5-alpha-L-arabinosidase
MNCRHRLRRAALCVAAAAAAAAGALAAMTPAATAGVRPAPAAPAAGATFTNPVFLPDLPDPSVIRDPRTGAWYAYGTTDYWTSSPSSLHIMPILTSRNLTSWTFVRNVFSPPGTAAAPGSPVQPAWTAGDPFLWAPEVHLIGGRYVMYYTASDTRAGGSAIGVATASGPAGPWHDSGGPLIAPEADPSGGYYSIIDPDEVRTPQGQRYLYFGSFNYGIHVVRLTAGGLAVAKGSTPVQVAAPGFYEGANVVYHRGYYYLFASSGNCCSGPDTAYEEVVGRSRSPLGPFTDKLGVPMNEGGISVVMADNGDGFTGPGGITVFRDGRQWWLVLHVVRESSPYLSSGATARPLAIEPLRWGRGGWPVVNGGRGVTEGPQPAPGSARAAAAGPGPDPLDRVPVPGRLLTAYSQDFTSARLGAQWSWVNEDAANWSLTSDPGTLTIDGQPGQFYQTEHSGQNVLLERAPAGNFIAQAKVALDPSENYQQAALVLWQDDDTWMRLSAESNSGTDATEWAKQADVTSPYPGFSCGPAYPAVTCPVYGSAFLEVPGFSPAARDLAARGPQARPAPRQPWAWLRIVRKGRDVTAYTSLNGRSWTPGATYNLDGFAAGAPLRVGILATSAGAPDPIPAHFAYVRVYALSGRTAPAAGA